MMKTANHGRFNSSFIHQMWILLVKYLIFSALELMLSLQINRPVSAKPGRLVEQPEFVICSEILPLNNNRLNLSCFQLFLFTWN